ncbi:Alpha/Beta hydrolase protein [Flagelloscypha sp. PMI_526]|nr:Alpha/Beta hydrolase protein [Flagelloscypha sp. PMI_526]
MFPLRRVPLALCFLRFAAASLQAPFRLDRNQSSSFRANSTAAMTQNLFALKQAPDLFSPQDLVSFPRPGAGVPNLAGDFLFVPLSQYDLSEGKNVKYIHVYSIGNPSVEPLRIQLSKQSEPFWLNTGRLIGFIKPNEQDPKVVDICSWDVSHFDAFPSKDGIVQADDMPSVCIGQIPHPEPSNFYWYPRSSHLVFSAYVWEDGKLETAAKRDEEYENRGNTGMVFDTTYERQWDAWKTPGRHSTLFTVQFYMDPGRQWRMNEDGRGFVNLLKSAETGHSTPVEPFGGAEDFAVSENYVVYSTLDPDQSKEAAWHTRRDIFITDIRGEGYPRKLTSGEQGATSSPVISPRQDKVAWLEMNEDGYEADKNNILIYDLTKNIRYTLAQEWDRSPSSLDFDKQGYILFGSVGDEARVKVFAIPVPPTPLTPSDVLPAKYHAPIALTSDGAVSGVLAMYTGRLVFTRNSLTSPNDVFVLYGLPHLVDYINALPEDKPMDFTLSSVIQSVQTKPGVEDLSLVQITSFTDTQRKGKTMNAGEDFWFKGAEGKKIQGFIVKPPGFVEGETKKWPAVLLIHGGPQSAWEDQWSTRWNPQVFASQGYFTVFINPTGSSTFGQELTDAIAGDWGGKPFVDLQLGWEHILKSYPEIDTERTVAAGASWGGYAINWIESNPQFSFNFKAVVCHDGVFDPMYNGFSTDELFFFNHDWHGKPWEPKTKELIRKFSPAEHADKWSVPMLVIHSSKDYRLAETEGIAAFHVLQQRGVPSRLLVFPDENHWVLKHGNSLKWHYEVFRWFDQFVGESAK